MSERITVGEYVWWWTRKKGQPPKKSYGQVLALSETGEYARIDRGIYMTVTIEVKRLKVQARHT